MKIINKFFPLSLILLTVLFIGYFIALFLNHDKVFYYNEKFGIYIVLQIIHIIVSVSSLVMIWISSEIDKWKKIDQTILIVCLSIIGLWIWFLKYYKKLIK